MPDPLPQSISSPLQVVLVEPKRRWLTRFVTLLLMGSLFVNFVLLLASADYLSETESVTERFHAGELLAKDKIARIVADFTIMPPYTHRIIEVIDHVLKKDDVKGVLLVIDSPGGLVSDSHEIYHRLRKLAEKKPIFISMKGLAASGGYYIAMGGGPEAPIYAEPTTWTGSIGVIMPRYDASELAKKIGVAADSLATGPLKDTLNPLKQMTPEEKQVWETILDDSFQRFLTVIDEGRVKLDLEQVRKLATGQVYTADQALKSGLVDVIGYEEDALEALTKKLGLTQVRVVDYQTPKSLAETLLGASAVAPSPPADPLSRLLNSGAPRAMYLFGWDAFSSRAR